MARRTKEDAEKTRHDILDAAEVLFQTQGVSRTSLQAIAAQAGLTRGAVYWHFKDKGDLFNAMMERITWPIENMCDNLLDQETLLNCPDPIAMLYQHHASVLALIATDERVRRLLEIALFRVELTEDMQVVRRKTFESEEDFYERILRIISLPQVQKRLAAGLTPEVAARAIQSAVLGLLRTWLLTSHPFDLQATGLQILQAQLHGFGLWPHPPNHIPPTPTSANAPAAPATAS